MLYGQGRLELRQVLLSAAAAGFNPYEVIRSALPLLKSYARPIPVAWNLQLAEVRPVVGKAIGAVHQGSATEGGGN
jgi:hypothetical protein